MKAIDKKYNEISDEIVYKGDFTDIIFTFVEKHFAGYGNGDVYADYKSGDKFLIIMGPLASSGFSDIDFLEKELIKKNDTVNTGYNITMGNR